MRQLFLYLYLMTLLLSSSANDLLPRDVQRFIDRREGCDHMRGEIPEPNARKRMREISREIEKLCKGTDKELAQLKKRYRENSSVLERLNEFESDIEAVEPPVVSKPARPNAKHGLVGVTISYKGWVILTLA